jgi:predicted RNase H-like nuclease (RuvC/YqgF family)
MTLYLKQKIIRLEKQIKEHKENIEALCDRLDYYENVQN